MVSQNTAELRFISKYTKTLLCDQCFL